MMYLISLHLFFSLFEYINKICATDTVQIHQHSGKKIKFMNVFHFIFTTSHTFHLVYSSPFSSCRDLQTLEPKVQFILQMFQHSDLYLKKCMCVHTYLNIGGVMVNMKLEENYLFSLITLFCDISH